VDEPSRTARVVAAHRLRCARPDPGFGDPVADDRLAADASDGLAADPQAPIGRYLAARTRAFDRAVLHAIERGNTQIVVLGAGYDGRALRFASDDVRWFEVDHPRTQADKRERVDRLAIDASEVRFVAVDFNSSDLAVALLDAGFTPDAPSLVICEGVVTYLTPDVVERLLAQVRTLMTSGSRLVLSHRADGASVTAERAARLGERFRFGDADLGEALERTRWGQVELSDGAARLGILAARPRWQPGEPPTRSVIGAYLDATFHRDAIDDLGRHLEDAYGVPTVATRTLDVGTVRVDRADGAVWVARVFPARTPARVAATLTNSLDYLARAGIPAERLADPSPLTMLAGQPVLVTEFVPGQQPRLTTESATSLGVLLARLHTAPDPPQNRGGAWHHASSTGGPAEEVAVISRLARSRPGMPARALAEIESLDTFADLPVAFTHPDFVPVNIIERDDGELIPIDWAGAGIAPRIWALGHLLWAIDKPHLIKAAIRAYTEHLGLTADEWDRLPAAVGARAGIFEVWSLATGRLAGDADALRAERLRKVEAIAAAARQALDG
jgi:methyltransferase (TIGR00027 family)